MKAISRSKLIMLALVMAITFAIFALPFIGQTNNGKVSANTTDGIVYQENFEGDLDSAFDGKISILNGKGVIDTNQNFSLPIAAADLPASNNYKISFDLQRTASSDFFFHLNDIDATHAGSIHLGIVGDGAFWKLVASNAGKDGIYNNSGDHMGALDYNAVNFLDEEAHVEIVHFEGYMELWVNGTRRVVTHLSNFGNNKYSTRVAIEEGTITGFGIHAGQSGVLTIDNIVVEESVASTTSYKETNNGGGDKIFGLTAQNLYKDNYRVNVEFEIKDATIIGYYPTVKLFGLNNTVGKVQNDREYSVNFQGEVGGTTINPGIFAANDDADNFWKGTGAQGPAYQDGSKLKYTIDVYGDNLDFYINDTLSVETTFTAMGIAKGHVQYIKVQLGNSTGVKWNSFGYDGFDDGERVKLSTEKDTVIVGTDVVVNAEVFGRTTEEYKWYVNDAPVSQTGTTLTLNDTTAGTYIVRYASDSFSGKPLRVTVRARVIEINETNSLTEGFALTEFNLESTLQGDYVGYTYQWYMDDIAITGKTTPTMTISGLQGGRHVFVLYATLGDDVVMSPEYVINIKLQTIELESQKKSYLKTESAVIDAILSGYEVGAEITWTVNGQTQQEKGAQLTLDMSTFGDAVSIAIKASSGGVESKELSLYVVYDVKDAITNLGDYKVIYSEVLDDSKTYGNFSVGEENGTKYLYSQQTQGETLYTVNTAGKNPANSNIVMEYKLYVPADYNQTVFVFPRWKGFSTTGGEGLFEMAIEVGAEGIYPFGKDLHTGTVYNLDNCGLGADFSYDSGVAKKGDWNTISVALNGKNLAMYVNGEMAVFFRAEATGIPSGFTFNWYPDGGTGTINLRIADIVFSGEVTPPPALGSVNLSVNATTMQTGGSLTFTALPNPFNAMTDNIVWYVNGEAVTNSGADKLRYEFTTEEEGEYIVHCVIDGITSVSKTITVEGESSNSWIWIVVGAVAAAAAITVAVVIIIKKKKK